MPSCLQSVFSTIGQSLNISSLKMTPTVAKNPGAVGEGSHHQSLPFSSSRSENMVHSTWTLWPLPQQLHGTCKGRGNHLHVVTHPAPFTPASLLPRRRKSDLYFPPYLQLSLICKHFVHAGTSARNSLISSAACMNSLCFMLLQNPRHHGDEVGHPSLSCVDNQRRQRKPWWGSVGSGLH